MADCTSPSQASTYPLAFGGLTVKGTFSPSAEIIARISIFSLMSSLKMLSKHVQRFY